MTIKTRYIVIVALAIVLFQALVLYFVLGNNVICPCGYVKIFDASVRSSQNSQHLLDWYSFSHIIFGFIMYFFLWLSRKKIPWMTIGVAFLVVLAVSAGWEVFENSYYAVHHFQTNTISYAYHGDSVINSVMDTVAAATGFWMAFFLPAWLIVVIAVALEIFVAVNIRDSFLLSAIMFTHSFPPILKWQAALSP